MGTFATMADVPHYIGSINPGGALAISADSRIETIPTRALIKELWTRLLCYLHLKKVANG